MPRSVYRSLQRIALPLPKRWKIRSAQTKSNRPRVRTAGNVRMLTVSTEVSQAIVKSHTIDEMRSMPTVTPVGERRASSPCVPVPLERRELR